MRRVSRIKFKENRNSEGKNLGYTAYLDGKQIAEIIGSSRTGFHTRVIGYNEEFQTKTRLEAEIKLAKKFDVPIQTADQETIDRFKKAFGNDIS